jgi:hypothetical protein
VREIDSLIIGKADDDLVFTMPSGTVLRLATWIATLIASTTRPLRPVRPK